jgi:hypothetical protein
VISDLEKNKDYAAFCQYLNEYIKNYNENAIINFVKEEEEDEGA